jgi:hypothetical protein
LGRLREFLDELTSADRGLLNESELSSEATIASVWRGSRLSCLKRGTIGSYLLGALEEPWESYTRFHLEEVRCLMCLANFEDIQSEDPAEAPKLSERLFQSSVGFLSFHP